MIDFQPGYKEISPPGDLLCKGAIKLMISEKARERQYRREQRKRKRRIGRKKKLSTAKGVTD